MIDTVLDEWINRAIQIGLVCGMYEINGQTISPAYISIRFHQYDIDEYLKFSDYINENYIDYEKIVEINQTANDEIELKFTFKGYNVIEFSVINATCKNFRIKDWFDRQPKDKSLFLVPDINQDINVLFELSDKDPDSNATKPIHIHKWFGSPL